MKRPYLARTSLLLNGFKAEKNMADGWDNGALESIAFMEKVRT